MRRAVCVIALLALAGCGFADNFNDDSGLIANEYGYWNGIAQSPDWELTSGSLFALLGGAWTGTPDDVEPDATSSNGTDSAVFRLTTKRYDFANYKTSFDLYQRGLVTTPSTPAVDWDGVHIFMRYQSEISLYYASVNRRDGHVVIKKKCPGGSENGGTYYTLAEQSGHGFALNVWQHVASDITTNTNGSVTVGLWREGVKVLSATDSGTGCAPIAHAGATGIRGDNDDFLFDNFAADQP